MRWPLPLIRMALHTQNALLWLVAWPVSRRDVRRIALYRTARIGDFIVTIPALVALRQRYPKAEIVLLTTASTTAGHESVARSLQGSTIPPWFSFVLPETIDRVEYLDGTDRQSMVSNTRGFVARFKPDVAIVLSSNLETFAQRLRKLVFFRIAGYCGPIFGWRMRQSLEFDARAQAEAGMIEHNVVTAAKSVYEAPGMPSFDTRELEFRMTIDSSARERVEALWVSQGWTGKRVVALFPGATFAHKRWPMDKYVEICHMIVQDPNTKLVVLGAESDREVTAALVKRLDIDVVDLTACLSLMELASFLARADAYLGSDTGPMHIATAMGTPTVAIMNHQELANPWEPWNSPGLGLKHDVPCQGCYSYEGCPLGRAICIEDLPVSQVMEAYAKALQQSQKQD